MLQVVRSSFDYLKCILFRGVGLVCGFHSGLNKACWYLPLPSKQNTSWESNPPPPPYPPLPANASPPLRHILRGCAFLSSMGGGGGGGAV